VEGDAPDVAVTLVTCRGEDWWEYVHGDIVSVSGARGAEARRASYDASISRPEGIGAHSARGNTAERYQPADLPPREGSELYNETKYND
jgi:hypothetical protein